MKIEIEIPNDAAQLIKEIREYEELQSIDKMILKAVKHYAVDKHIISQKTKFVNGHAVVKWTYSGLRYQKYLKDKADEQDRKPYESQFFEQGQEIEI